MVVESGDQEIELIKETDSLEEINRKTLACASIGINPYTGKKIIKKKRINSSMLHGQEHL
ncbi:hypothetical protein ACPCF3_01905 [Enterococcus mundtii]